MANHRDSKSPFPWKLLQLPEAMFEGSSVSLGKNTIVIIGKTRNSRSLIAHMKPDTFETDQEPNEHSIYKTKHPIIWEPFPSPSLNATWQGHLLLATQETSKETMKTQFTLHLLFKSNFSNVTFDCDSIPLCDASEKYEERSSRNSVIVSKEGKMSCFSHVHFLPRKHRCVPPAFKKGQKGAAPFWKKGKSRHFFVIIIFKDGTKRR